MDTFLPPKFSMNPFFVRHVAKPKRLIHIEGLHRAPICAVVDDGYIPSKGYANAFPPNNYNDNIIKYENRRKERMQPPGGRFQPHGLIENTDKWRDELNKLAVSVGLITSDDIEIAKKQKERKKYIKNLEKEANKGLHSSATSRSKSPDKKPTSSYSTKTSRLNEPLLTGRRTSRSSIASRALSTAIQNSYIVNESDREIWMLKVLCQILETDNLVDIQSWLVSSDSQEKDKVKKMISHAMKGLEASGRIEHLSNENISFDNMQKNLEAKTPVNLEDLQNTIEKISIKTPLHKEDSSRFSRHLSGNKKPFNTQGAQNILKLPDIEEDPRSNQINEISHLNEDNENFHNEKTPIENTQDNNEKNKILDTKSDELSPPISPVFNINIFPQTKPVPTPVKEEKAIVKVEAPTKDYKIEELNVKLVVKDEKSKLIQKIEGNWKPEASIPKDK